MSVEPPEPRKTLRCASFHSVKGGVGKSTLSYLVARSLAADGPVALIDADLTGTSLADVLSLRSPAWNGEHERLPLDQKPDFWLATDPKRMRLQERSMSGDDPHARFVPLLNDFLLWDCNRYDVHRDVEPEALFWKLPEKDPLADRLFVIPSSALPNDLSQILPLIYDELQAAYLESRLEWLLHWILAKTNVRTVVFDTPPTIPGLSRAILSMALRLPEYTELAEDGGTPLELTSDRTSPITWSPFLIATTDLQDIRAAERWLVGRPENEIERIAIILNRTTKAHWDDLKGHLLPRLIGDYGDVDSQLPPELSLYDGSLLRESAPPLVVEDRHELRIFGGDPLSVEAMGFIDTLANRVRNTR